MAVIAYKCPDITVVVVDINQVQTLLILRLCGRQQGVVLVLGCNLGPMNPTSRQVKQLKP